MIRLLTQREASVWLGPSERTGLRGAVMISNSLTEVAVCIDEPRQLGRPQHGARHIPAIQRDRSTVHAGGAST
jgi:hypothetical protein